jgi:hypothetical protein
LSISKSFLLLGGFIGADTAVCSSRDTPFGIFYYVVESNRIVIQAVLNLRQDPKKIRERFSEREYFTLICLLAALITAKGSVAF